MEQKAKIMNVGNIAAATGAAKGKVIAWIKLANYVSTDSRKAERLNAYECKGCFYGGSIGGAAMTTRPCMSCGEVQMYGSTYTDVLCIDCAKKHRLCKHCGGDINMKLKRDNWGLNEKE